MMIVEVNERLDIKKRVDRDEHHDKSFYEIHKKINIHESIISQRIMHMVESEWINILNSATICKLCIIFRLSERI
jgi:hypothetical protein